MKMRVVGTEAVELLAELTAEELSSLISIFRSACIICTTPPPWKRAV